MGDTCQQTPLLKCFAGHTKMTNNLIPKSTSVTDLHNLQITGSNRLQPFSGMWEVNKNGHQNETRPEMVRLSMDSSFSLLRSDFGFKRERTDTFEGLLRQNHHVFYVRSDGLEEKFRQVASRHLEALQTQGSRLSASEADSAIGRLRTVLCPVKFNGHSKRSDNQLMPPKKGPERKREIPIDRDRKGKAFISGASGFKTNLQHQLIKKYLNTVPNCQSSKDNQFLKINGTNISKKNQ